MKTPITAVMFFLAASLLQSMDSTAQRSRSRNDYAYHRESRHSYDRNYNRFYQRRSSGISIVAALPFGSVAVSIGGRPYHYHQGLFYRSENYGYILTPPPAGIIVPFLPQGSLSVMLEGRRCYYYSDTYYMPVDGNRYQVINSPAKQNNARNNNDGVAANEAYEKIVIDGKTYYKKGTTYYKAQVNDNGEIAYEEVGQAGK